MVSRQVTLSITREELIAILNEQAAKDGHDIIPENARITVQDPCEGDTVEVDELDIIWHK